MKLSNYHFLLFFVFVLFFGCTPFTEKQLSPFELIDKEVLQNSKAYSDLKVATETIGHRLTGSLNGHKAEELAYQLLQSYGYDSLNLRYQPFEAQVWSRGKLSLKVATLKGKKFSPLPAASLAFSPLETDVTAELADLGSGLEEDFKVNRHKVYGKIVLVYIGILSKTKHKKRNLHRSEKVALAAKYGAKGIIFYNSVQGGVLLTGTASLNNKLVPIPSICIDHEAGMALRRRLRKSRLKVAITMQNSFETINARNIIATLPGTVLPEEKILIGAHLDSWDLGTGVIDNGIGAFSVIDIARTFKTLDLPLKRTVEFALFMGEEQGLIGAKAFVKQAADSQQIHQIKYMVNLDMTLNPKGFNAAGRPEAIPFIENLGAKIQAVDTTFLSHHLNTIGLHSDHQPFMLKGIPILSMVNNVDESIFSCYHAACDNLDLIDKQQLKNTVRFTTMMLHELSNVDSLPAMPYNSEQTKQFLIEKGFKENLVLNGEWMWKK